LGLPNMNMSLAQLHGLECKMCLIFVSYSWNYMVCAYRQRRFPYTIEYLNDLISYLIKGLRKSDL
jgi:hypothetical protein